MDSSRDKISRGDALRGLIVLPALAAAVLASGTQAQAAKSSKAALKYQDKPKGDQKCSGCKFYRAAKNHKAKGTCTIVDGSISPNGWCIAYAKK